MRTRRFLAALVAVIVVAAAVATVSWSQSRMLEINKQHRLTDTDVVDNAPPMVAFTTVALGCFRGLLADLLWLRSISLQDQGKYFEMVQLADWICKLQPRFTGATAYLAWNMAYNISVTFSDPADRWRWVQHGIELLRDALTYSPGDANLYRELGWIYQHKVGNIFDDANLYYKQQMALEMTKVFGGPEPDWKALAAAPATPAAFWLDVPGGKELLESKMRKAGIESLSSLEDAFRQSGKLPAGFLEDAADAPCRLALDNYLRARWLNQFYKLRPAEVIKIDKQYGDFDWRLPQAYAVYWATLGKEYSRDSENINCERMINQSVKDAFLEGRLLMAGEGDTRAFITVPNMSLADAARRSFESSFEDRKSVSFTSSYENFMIDSILIFYTFGNRTKADDYLKTLRRDFPGNPEFRRDLDSFVIGRWRENVIDGSRQKVKGIIDGFLFKICVFMAFGDDQAAKGHEQLARAIYETYKDSQKDSWERSGLPPFEKMKSEVLSACLKNLSPSLADKLRSRLGFAGAKDADKKDAPPDSSK